MVLGLTLMQNDLFKMLMQVTPNFHEPIYNLNCFVIFTKSMLYQYSC
jgi:hypothetical protein